MEKVFPWHPVIDHFDSVRSLSKKDAQDLRKWGFNIVRLGTMWPGVEPARGQYNYTYLRQLERIVNILGEEGIVTILDLHQDLLSPLWCGEGIPDWAAKIAVNESSLTWAFPQPIVFEKIRKDPITGHANLEDCLKYPFGMFYLSEAVNVAFQSLYDNVGGLQDSFVSFWSVVAQHFANNANVIGFELINEPWSGNLFKNISFTIQRGLADKINLKPMYDRAASMIRSVPGASDKLIFYEPSTIDQIFGTSNGFTTGPGGAKYDSQNVYSYHSYCVLSDRYGNPFSATLCDAIDSSLFGLWTDTYKRLGGGGMMTEWGALSTQPGALQQMQRIAQLADDHLQSWIWWQFKDYDDVTTASIGDVESFYFANGTLQHEKVKTLARSYARAIVGTPVAMNFEISSGNFKLSYRYNATVGNSQAASVPTEIYVAQPYYYEHGFKYDVSPGVNCQFFSETFLLLCRHDSSVRDGSLVSISIVPLPARKKANH